MVPEPLTCKLVVAPTVPILAPRAMEPLPVVARLRVPVEATGIAAFIVILPLAVNDKLPSLDKTPVLFIKTTGPAWLELTVITALDAPEFRN